MIKTIILGFDAFDPVLFEKYHSEGKTPNLSRFVEAGGYARFSVTDPPQSEVSWTSIATGLNPGGHGLFDFVHRNPATYNLHVSLLPTKSGVLGKQFARPYQTKTIFDAAASDGYPATSLWWPATFPARLDSPVRTIPGLGAPDIFGRLGVGTSYSIETLDDQIDRKTQIKKLTQISRGRFSGEIEGPTQRTLSGTKETGLKFDLEVVDEQLARMTIGKQRIDLTLGQWSSTFELNFRVGFGFSVRSITRGMLTKTSPYPTLYLLPLQLHPSRSLWPYANPKGLVKSIWKDHRRILTLGWPQDTTALEEEYINDDQFLDLCDQIFEEREHALMVLLDSFKEGVLACVFDSLDRIQHMFWKRGQDVLERWYIKLDALVGRIQDQLKEKRRGEDIHLLIVSDHGFGDFDYKVHLNRWLINRGYLVPREADNSVDLSTADWRKSQAYALGLNSLYINQEGREGQGNVSDSQKNELMRSLHDDLLRWKSPNGHQVVQRVLLQEEAFQGPLAKYGPDMVIGYSPAYRASSETGLGGWGAEEIETNWDHWEADHCFDGRAVPGVLFSNRGLDHIAKPSYADIPVLAINKELSPEDTAPPPSFSDEDQDTIEERLKGLGYL